jgi:uncharacterized membrane protein
MPNCSRCGTDNDASAKFCKNCGFPLTTQGSAPPPPPPPGPGYPPPPPPGYGQPADPGMQQNVAALLCYVLGWLTGLIFLFIDKRPFVRFHAMQSILVFGGIHVLHLMLAWVLFPALHLWVLMFAVSGMLSLVSLILWVLLMVKAYQNEWYKVPYIGDIALQKSQQQ